MLDPWLETNDKCGQRKRRGQQGDRCKSPEKDSQVSVVVLRLAVTVLCGVGLYASLFMLGKARKAKRGELSEPSVVQTPRARLFGGVSNALLGVLYYPAVVIASWSVHTPFALALLLTIVSFAALTSLVLAISLLFVTRMPCVYCWTSHAINWTLVPLVATLFKLSYWR